MKTYKLSKEYNYVIYGAAFLGVQILTGLRNSGYNVNAFLDKRASELKEVEGVKVYEPQSYKSDNKEKIFGNIYFRHDSTDNIYCYII